MSFKIFRKNLKFLFKTDIKKELKNHLTMDQVLDHLYEIKDELKDLKVPKIDTVEETITCLQQGYSICRFGDGELELMLGNDIAFQSYSKTLQEKLIEIFQSSYPKLKIAIPRVIYYSKSNITDVNKEFWRKYIHKYRCIIEKYIDYEKDYGVTEVTLGYSYFKDYDYKSYFDNIRKIWDKRECVLVCGETVFKDIQNNIFDNAKSIQYINCPRINAFENYDNILTESLKYDTNKLFIIICGPTAKVLAYDLFKKGYQALDLGHIAKQYDWFVKGKHTNTEADSTDFLSQIKENYCLRKE